MNFEAIETAFELLLENVQTIENDLGTHAYDALIEQNSYYFFTIRCNTSEKGVIKRLFILDKVNYQVRFQLINTMLK